MDALTLPAPREYAACQLYRSPRTGQLWEVVAVWDRVAVVRAADAPRFGAVVAKWPTAVMDDFEPVA